MMRISHVAMAALVTVVLPASAGLGGESADVGRLSGGVAIHTVARGDSLTRISPPP